MSEQPDGARPYRTRDDLPGWQDVPGAQHPGVFPFLRGIHPQMYTERTWRMRQYAGFGTPEDTNERWRTLIARGQDGISCAFDLPTQVGLDADDDRARADAGRLGVSISTLDDFMALFQGISLEHTAATFNINGTAAIIYAMLLEVADHQGADFERLTGTLANDPLIEYVARGLWSLAPDGAMRLMADTFAYSLEHTPNYYAMNLRGTLVYEAGGTAVHEMGYAMTCAIAYLDKLADRGLDMERVTRRFSFLLFSDSDLLEQAAKFRAGRMVWAELVKERYGVVADSGQRMRFTAAVGNFNLRPQHPELNLVRNTLGVIGAVLGGCQAMLVAGMDEAFEIPSEYNALLGLYTQQVVALESEITRSVDPLGGSYYIESRTDEIFDAIRELIDEIEATGGAIAGIESGDLQARIGDAAFQAQLDEESGATPIVGVNTPGSQPPEDPQFELHQHDADRINRRRRQLRDHRHARSAQDVKSSLDELRAILATDTNAIPAIRVALRAGATVGELTSVCRDHYGDFHEPMELSR